MAYLDGYFPRPKGQKPGPPTYDAPTDLVDAPTNFHNFEALTPWASGAGEAASAAATRLSSGGAGPLYSELESQAMQELKLGGELGEDEVRAANQGGLAGWSSRGLGRSPGAGFAAVLSRLAAANGRKDARRGFASHVEGLRQQQQESDRATLGAATGAATAGLGLAEEVRQYDQNREDSLTNDRNSFFFNVYDAQAKQAAANKARRAGILSGVLGAVGSVFGGGK